MPGQCHRNLNAKWRKSQQNKSEWIGRYWLYASAIWICEIVPTYFKNSFKIKGHVMIRTLLQALLLIYKGAMTESDGSPVIFTFEKVFWCFAYHNHGWCAFSVAGPRFQNSPPNTGAFGWIPLGLEISPLNQPLFIITFRLTFGFSTTNYQGHYFLSQAIISLC